MTSKWLENADATHQLKFLLEQAGLPLELHTEQLANDFCRSHNQPDKVHVTSEKVVYAPPGAENDYREIDQRIQIYEEFEIGKLTGIQLTINMPIECKNRWNTECFAFPLRDKNSHFGFPIVSDFGGSSLIRYVESSYTALKPTTPASAVLVEIEDGQTPKKLYKENLIYNAAGSLYDFVLFDLSGFDEDEEDRRPTDQENLLLRRFNQYLNSNGYVWWSTLRQWMKNIDSSEFDAYNEEMFGSGRIYHPVSAHLPIVCLNSPLYEVEVDGASKIKSFKEIDYCLSRIRKRGWPGKSRFKLAMRTPEVAVIVTNLAGLPKALELGFQWYEEIKYFFRQAPAEMERKWPLESAFFRSVVRYHAKDEGTSYRSDLDIGQWL